MAAAPRGRFCFLLKRNKTSHKRAAWPWGPAVPGLWGRGCWRAAACLLPAVIGFSFSSARTKGPLRGGGEAAPRQLSALAALHSSSKTLDPRRRERGWDPRKESAWVEKGGLGADPAWGQGCAVGSPHSPPSVSPLSPLCSIRPGGDAQCSLGAVLPPGHSCPLLREETTVPFCGVGRAVAVAISDRAAGQSPTPRCPLQCHIPRTWAGGRASFPLDLCREAVGKHCLRLRWGTGQAVPFPNAPRDLHGVGKMHKEGFRLCSSFFQPLSPHIPTPFVQWVPGSQRPRRVSPSGCCSRRGSGRCIWSHPHPNSAGCRGWGAAGTLGTGRCSAQQQLRDTAGYPRININSPPRTLPTGMMSDQLPPAPRRGPLPGVDAILSAEGVLDGKAPVVELQGREAALIQAHHLTVGQGVCLGAIPCRIGTQHPAGSPSPPNGEAAWGGPAPFPAPTHAHTECSLGTPMRCPVPTAAPSFGSHRALLHCLQLPPAQRLFA